ncbi:helix-turn-helix domain-containing protein [Candidatus Poriferisodalis sp.]|uniref:AraC family transcriptional regulator n=1 Tax=Candidatus Poriferisodalis sp. TaxID=3101277 RepID=UPI003B01CDE3
MLTTETVEPSDRFEYWREVICRVYVRLEADPVGDGLFSGTVDVASFGDVQVSTVVADGQVVTRVLDGESDDCLVSLQTAGVGRVSQSDRTAVLRPGDLALYDATLPYELAFDDAFRQIVVKFPRRQLIERNIDIPAAVGLRTLGSESLARVAGGYLRALRGHDIEFADPHRRVLGNHAVDLLAMALSPHVGTATSAPAARTYSRQQALDYVAANISDPRLSVSRVASALAMSPRSLQKLFAQDECGLGERIRRARLARARAALADPLRRHHSIARIAADHGYADAAHFSRAFRAMHGQTPRDYRRGLDAGLAEHGPAERRAG